MNIVTDSQYQIIDNDYEKFGVGFCFDCNTSHVTAFSLHLVIVTRITTTSSSYKYSNVIFSLEPVFTGIFLPCTFGLFFARTMLCRFNCML